MPEESSDINGLVGRILSIVARRRWWIVLPMCLIGAGAALVSLVLPNHYRSAATIEVDSRKISNEYVVAINTGNPTDVVNAIQNKILSRTRLLQIADEFHLYQRLAGNPEARLEAMRNDIELQPLDKNSNQKMLNTFLVAFTALSPDIAQKVAERLTQLFIRENLNFQQERDKGATAFLNQQLVVVRANLDKSQAALATFKAQHLGELPEEQQSNLEALTGLQMQLQTAQSNLMQARQQRAALQSSLAFQAASNADGVTSSTESTPLSKARADLAQLTAQRDALLARYSPLYPDVINLNQEILKAKARVHALTSESPSGSAGVTTPKETSDPAVVQIKSQLAATDAEIKNAEQISAKLQTKIDEYQSKLGLEPLRQQQLSELEQEYTVAQKQYAELLGRQSESELAAGMAQQEGSKDFQMIDPPDFPWQPSGPHRMKIAAGGLAGGLFLGLALAFLVDSRDRSFHTESEVRTYLSIPMVVGVPPLDTPKDMRARRNTRRIEWVMAVVLTLLVTAAEILVLRRH